MWPQPKRKKSEIRVRKSLKCGDQIPNSPSLPAAGRSPSAEGSQEGWGKPSGSLLVLGSSSAARSPCCRRPSGSSETLERPFRGLSGLWPSFRPWRWCGWGQVRNCWWADHWLADAHSNCAARRTAMPARPQYDATTVKKCSLQLIVTDLSHWEICWNVHFSLLQQKQYGRANLSSVVLSECGPFYERYSSSRLRFPWTPAVLFYHMILTMRSCDQNNQKSSF